jgi:ABC-type uncharacterized transport system substrate-binding protein
MLHMTVLRCCAVALACVAFGSPALAHPHAWIETRSDVVFDDEGRIAAINVEWDFDPGYSEMAVEGLDENGDGFHSAGELHAAGAREPDCAEGLRLFHQGARRRRGGRYGDVTEYGMIYSNGILKMHFTVPLAEPLDPFAAEFVYRIYDPSFYIAIDFAENAARPARQCARAVQDRAAPGAHRRRDREPPATCWPRRTRTGSRRRRTTSAPCSPNPSPSCASRRPHDATCAAVIVLAALLGLLQAPAATGDTGRAS